jgi:hypothetical protein
LLALSLLLATNGPLFVCMPLTNDTAMYDLQAGVLLDGGVLYRDVLEPNFPGVVWIHAAVRSLLGTSSEAMRLFDLAIYSAIVLLLTRCLAREGRSAGIQAWSAFALFLFYFSITEWSHCQRDVWLLAPAVAGLLLRGRWAMSLAGGETRRHSMLQSIAEGAVWGAAVWLKPMVVIPMLAAWAASVLYVRRARPVLRDLAGLITGGLIVGAAGVAWLVWSGAWPYFWETLLQWNPRYFEAGKEHWTLMRFMGTTTRLFPWIVLHLAAAPVAVWVIMESIRQSWRGAVSPARFSQAMFGVFYLGWLVQAFFFQHLFDYVHTPGVLLAVVVLAPAVASASSQPKQRYAVAGFLALAVFVSPILRSDRLSIWGRCWREGSTPENRNVLARFPYPDWQDIDRTAAYLRGLKLRDGELTCYHNNLVYLYDEVGLKPSTRYVYLEVLLIFFPERRAEFRSALSASGHKYVVSDLHAAELTPEELRQGKQGENGELPPAFPQELRNRFPWSYPVAYRAGSIAIHRVPENRKAAAKTSAN